MLWFETLLWCRMCDGEEEAGWNSGQGKMNSSHMVRYRQNLGFSLEVGGRKPIRDENALGRLGNVGSWSVVTLPHTTKGPFPF